MTPNTKRYTLSRNMSFLREGDNERRDEFARTMLGKMDTDPHFIDSICFSDKSTFHTSGLVHWHNVRIWKIRGSSDKLKGLHRKSTRSVGFYTVIVQFFEEDTVCQTNFLRLRQEKVTPEHQVRHPYVIFQLEGAPAHWGLTVRETLHA